MFKLYVVQAKYGDCLILEAGPASASKFVLIDGGPENIYDVHLRGELKKIRQRGGKLDLMMLSHVDNDHVIGLLDLIAELRAQRANHETETIAIQALWHNSFSQTLGEDSDMEERLEALREAAGEGGQAMRLMGMTVRAIKEGHQLTLAAEALETPLNPGFPQGIVILDDHPDKIMLGDLSLLVVGPTRQNLAKLKQEWLDWLDEQEEGVKSLNPYFNAALDGSFRNLSSIMALAEADGKRVLLTGDGRSDHLLQGLEQAGVLDSQGSMHVDVLKLAHHGSHANSTPELFRRVLADRYVVSASGKHRHPNYDTLTWLVEAAKEQGRTIEIVLTNETSGTKKLLENYDPGEYGYRFRLMEKGKHAIPLELA
jgi:ribonuclease BN (tRNA processing enzyme)